MTEHKVWAIIDKYDSRLHHVSIDQNPIGDSLVTRCVEATLTIPDEPEWTVALDRSVDGIGHHVVSVCRKDTEPLPFIEVDVRAPDAQTALARALDQRGAAFEDHGGHAPGSPP